MSFAQRTVPDSSRVSLVPLTAPVGDAVLASVPIPAEDCTALHDAERRVASGLTQSTRPYFVAGRLALRAALDVVSPGRASYPLLRTARGAPSLPPGLLGSVSHKRTRAVALASTGDHGHIGVDLEHRAQPSEQHRPSIATRILTAREQEAMGALDPLAHRDATMLRFALKEAIYKAIDPLVGRYVRFTEVEVDVHDDGRATVTLLLPELATSSIVVHAHWQCDDEWIIAMARSHP